ncbi:MAG: hypothetical protein HY710_09295, partial [Candidatus Latescibacteria bacterium]|nr:hypothetical protein [Candidatus Latescibacterota bacterium]
MRWSALLLIWPVCLAAAITQAGAQTPATPEFVKVYGPHTVGQTFQYSASNLDRIGLWVRKPAVANHHDLVVRVRKSSSARRDIVVIRTPVASLASGDIQWFRFRPLGDDEVPTFYVQVESPGSTEANALVVKVERGPVAGTVGPVEMGGVARDGALTIRLSTERSIWTRIGYVLARFEVDKPWFYDRYFFVTLFVGYVVLLVGFLRYTLRLLREKSPQSGETADVSRTFMGYVIGLFIVRGILYSSLFPAWQAPDEPAHFAMIRYLAEHRTLPDVETAQIDRDVLESMDKADYAVILKGGRPRPDWQTWIEDPRDISVLNARA